MENPIVGKILKDGIASVNLAMLDENARKRILNDVAENCGKKTSSPSR